MSTNKAWFSPQSTTLENRIRAVQNVNDPTILSDDVQRWSVAIMALLLIFTTFLSTFAYFNFFKGTFGPILAGGLAIIIAGCIEFGKNYFALKAVRIPFFMGWGYVWNTVHGSVMWAALALFAGCTFYASVYNSTVGAKALSLLIIQEKDNSSGRDNFAANTADLDGQISTLSKSIDQDRAIKWNGTTTYQAQKSIERKSKTLDKLVGMKEKTATDQRYDFEKGREIRGAQSSFSANTLLLVGGFIEALQFILLFLRVSSERSLDRSNIGKNTVPQPPQHKTAGFEPPIQGFENPLFATRGNTYPENSASGAQIRWQGYGEAAKNTVPQSPQHFSAPREVKAALGSDAMLLLLRQKMQREIPNLARADANPQTVFNRIEKELLTVYEAMQKPDFNPSSGEIESAYKYFPDAFARMRSFGFPFSLDSQFLYQLFTHMD